jgi:type II secretory pathway pseudopilin PulG
MNRPSRTSTSRRLASSIRLSSRNGPPAGFTLIDLVAATAVVALVLAIGVHFIQQARITARATGCRENLRQIGVALSNYTDAHRVLPVVTLIGPGFQLAHSPQALLLAYLPEGHVLSYNPGRPWFEQSGGIGAVTVPVFRCPASSHRDPVDAYQARRMSCPLGTVLGTTDYIASRGSNDSWCVDKGVSGVVPDERGAFEIGRPIRLGDMTDGLSTTIVFGEGTAGDHWPISVHGTIGRWALDATGGRPVPACNFWCWPFLNTVADQDRTRIVSTSVFGTTASPLNKRPVSETLVDTKKLADCAIDSSNRTVSSLSGFRSDHAGGGFFLFADGSTHFVSQDIGQYVYSALSTIAGGESVQFAN